MIDREQALSLLDKHIENKNIIKHMLATEAVMRRLAERFEPEKKELWGLAGLLHDIDYEEIEEDEEHGLLSMEILKNEGVELPEEVLRTIKAHCYNLHPEDKPQNKMEWSLFILDSLTGLIVATTLVHPGQEIKTISVESVMKKYHDSSFAKGTRREEIAMCEEKLGIPLEDFVKINLEAMQEIASELGLE
jgi:hypothetical protein